MNPSPIKLAFVININFYLLNVNSETAFFLFFFKIRQSAIYTCIYSININNKSLMTMVLNPEASEKIGGNACHLGELRA